VLGGPERVRARARCVEQQQHAFARRVYSIYTGTGKKGGHTVPEKTKKTSGGAGTHMDTHETGTERQV
jgi:hypothetical protein